MFRIEKKTGITILGTDWKVGRSVLEGPVDYRPTLTCHQALGLIGFVGFCFI